jgi:hypothetical protein
MIYGCLILIIMAHLILPANSRENNLILNKHAKLHIELLTANQILFEATFKYIPNGVKNLSFYIDENLVFVYQFEKDYQYTWEIDGIILIDYAEIGITHSFVYAKLILITQDKMCISVSSNILKIVNLITILLIFLILGLSIGSLYIYGIYKKRHSRKRIVALTIRLR